MGADKAIHIKDAAGGRGPLGIARVLADTIRERKYDAVLFGRQSIDSDNSAVGIAVARLLDLPVVSLVTKLEMKDGVAHAHREAEGGTEVIEVKLPAVFTAQRGLAEPRYPSIKGIMMAKKKPIEEVEAPAPSGRLEIEKLSPPPERAAGKIVARAATNFLKSRRQYLEGATQVGTDTVTDEVARVTRAQYISGVLGLFTALRQRILKFR